MLPNEYELPRFKRCPVLLEVRGFVDAAGIALRRLG